MRARLLLFLVLFVFSTQAQIVNIPDPIFKQALLDHGFNGNQEIDTNFDGEIQVSEAEALTGLLDVNGQFIDIYDLTGIEAFVNITELSVWQNQLTSLDLSSNTKLIGLSCSENPLTSLNISQCVDLEDLFSEHTPLTSIDLTSNLNLQQVILRDNLLVNLNLTSNLNLQVFSCSINSLTFLDIRTGNNVNITGFSSTNNPNLTCVFVDDAVYSEDNWFRDPASTFVETEVECDDLGVNDNLLKKISIYPNPVKEILYIDNYDLRLTTYDVQIFDITGKLLQQSKIVNLQSSINLSHLPTGIYFLQLQNKNSATILTRKIIKL